MINKQIFGQKKDSGIYLQKRKMLMAFIYATQKKKFSIKDFSSQCKQIRSLAYLHTFTGEILNTKPRFWCSVDKAHIGTETAVKSCHANASTIFSFRF